jgi:hypothetical protein
VQWVLWKGFQQEGDLLDLHVSPWLIVVWDQWGCSCSIGLAMLLRWELRCIRRAPQILPLQILKTAHLVGIFCLVLALFRWNFCLCPCAQTLSVLGIKTTGIRFNLAWGLNSPPSCLCGLDKSLLIENGQNYTWLGGRNERTVV